MTTPRELIAAELAAVARVTDTPAAPFGYGADLRCAGDIPDDFGEVGGAERLAIAEAAARRLDCPRGQLPDDPSYGISLPSYLNRGTTATALADLGRDAQAELAKDDRFKSVTVQAVTAPGGLAVTLTVAIDPVDATLGPFTLTLAVTSATVILEAIK
jgi:hypothetical protein